MLADMVQKGEIQLSDPLTKYLPGDVKVPSQGDRPITLADLATHTSGLPSVPDNAEPDMHNPFRGYTLDKAYEFLRTYTLPRPIGTQYVYSNFGMGLLGQAIAQRAGRDYEDLIRSRVTAPLQMNSTSVALSASMRKRLVQGYIHPGRQADPWTIVSLQGMGALHSTANDLLRFLSVSLGLQPHPLYCAITASHTSRHPAGAPDREIALGWHIDRRLGNSIVWHNGLTTGYRSYVGIDVRAQRGVVVLSNTGVSIEDIGRHVLDARFEVKRYGPPKSLVDLSVQRGFQDLPSIYSEYRGREPTNVPTEDQLNQWGYSLLWRKRPAEAVAVLALATTLYPSSSNLHESLGEMHEANGQITQAIESHRRALTIDPANQEAKSRLQALTAQTNLPRR
jgi:CubicO group peptidase (beta-lactamase class C family)